MRARSELIEKVFNQLNKDNMKILDIFYDPDIVFQDPLGKIKGLAGMHAYYAHLYQNVRNIRFDITQEVVQGHVHVVFWSMYLTAAGLNKGQEVIVDGNSVIQFGESGKVTYHRDYFDMGEFVYEHVPILRWLVNKVKRRLKASHDS